MALKTRTFRAAGHANNSFGTQAYRARLQPPAVLIRHAAIGITVDHQHVR
jgi:hypothetical protein